MNYTIYHNPRCKKSRAGLAYLQNKNINPNIVLYLESGFSIEELTRLYQQLNVPIDDLIRKNEDVYKANFREKKFTDEEWIRIIVEHPKLLARPIVRKGHRAVIADPVERIDSIL